MLDRISSCSLANRVAVLLVALLLAALGLWSFRHLLDRRRPGHHQRPGADQHRGARLHAARSRAAHHAAARERDGGPCAARLHALAVALRTVAGHRRSSRKARTSTSRASRWRNACRRVRPTLPPGIEPQMGPAATGLGEIFMYTVDADAAAGQGTAPASTAQELRAGAGLDRPAAVAACARRGGRQHDRRLPEAVPGAAGCRSDCWPMASRWPSWSDVARTQQCQSGRRVHRAQRPADAAAHSRAARRR